MLTRHAMSNLLGAGQGCRQRWRCDFEKAFGVSADMLMRMHAAHDFAWAQAREDTIEGERLAA